MSASPRRLFLLGPQPHYASLKTVLERVELRAPVAIISAGWETEEQQDHDLRQAIGGPCVNLNLFARTEQLFAQDPELIAQLRNRQDELRHVRDAYTQRLGYLLKAARQMIRRRDSVIDLGPERESAIEMVRQLDRDNLVRTTAIIEDYENRLQTTTRPHVLAHRNEVAEVLGQSCLLIITGGHVGIILNRMKIFGVLDTAPDLPIAAWSGAAMALSEQVVFYHDSPPQGPGNPEVLRRGMQLFPEILPLPDGNERLSLDDRTRVELFARRFRNSNCVLLNPATILERSDGTWQSIGSEQAVRLNTNGHVTPYPE